jgi:hypothetical protein
VSANDGLALGLCSLLVSCLCNRIARQPYHQPGSGQP